MKYYYIYNLIAAIYQQLRQHQNYWANKLHSVDQFRQLTKRVETTFWIEAFQSKKSEYNFNGERSPVHKIAIEEVRIFFWGEPIECKYVEQVKILHKRKQKIKHRNQYILWQQKF